MEFFDAVIRYETALWSYAERALREAGAGSLADLAGLRAIAAHGDTCRVHEISRDLGNTIGAASKLVDRLERAGLAQRRPNPADGRSSFVALTAAGERARVAGEAALTEAVSRHLAGSSTDTDVVATALGTLTALLAEPAEVRA